MKNLFADDNEMLAECDQLVKDDSMDAEDRATIGAFYNGRDTMSTCEADAQGQTEITNHLFGYDSLNTARIQIESIFTKTKNVWNFKMYDAPAEYRQEWEMATAEDFNAIIRDSRRLKPHVKSMAGQVTLYGSSHFMWRDIVDWCPVVARPLVPTGTGILASDIPYACVPSFLTLGELVRAKRSAEKLRDKGEKSFWSIESLERCIDTLQANVSVKPTSYGVGTSQQTVDEREQMRQEGGASAQYRMKLPVYYLYIARPDEEGTPFDMIILARWTPQQREDSIRRNKLILPVKLFEKERMYKSAAHWLNPYFIDTSLGGETSWHRCMGLGHLNYDSDVDVETFFNTAMQGSLENLRRTFRADSQADWDAIARWNQGQTPSNVLPPGIKIEEAAKNPNFQYAFTTIQMLQGLARRKASAAIGNAGDNTTDELEIQALERQGRNAEALASRMSDIYEATDSLGREIFRRMVAPLPLESDPGYEEISAFQKCLRKKGVPVELLRKWANSDEKVLCVETSRAGGDGDRVRTVMVNQMLMSRLPLFNPEAQQTILRRVMASETQDYQFAEEIVPYEKKPDGNQVQSANVENQACLLRGITGFVPPIQKEDLHMEHLPEHFGGMQGLLAKGQMKGWDEIDLAGFKAIGSHAGAHIQSIMAIPEQKDLAKQAVEQLQQLAKAGQEFANNMKPSQPDPAEAKELELKERKQQLSERAQLKLEEHRGAAMDLSRRKQASNEVLESQRLADQENSGAHKRYMDEVKVIEGKRDRIMERANKRSESAKERAFAKAQAEKEPAPA